MALPAPRQARKHLPRPLAKTRPTGHIGGMKHGSTRDHLLATGLRVMHAQGFNATGVQDITQAAGVPKGSFYNHFDS
jgi:AcrR family transcriptional regulator